jgi:lipid-binding SYLF domain-containing protein
VSAPSNALLAVGPLGTNINSSVSWSMDAGVTYYYLTNSSFDGLPFA